MVWIIRTMFLSKNYQLQIINSPLPVPKELANLFFVKVSLRLSFLLLIARVVFYRRPNSDGELKEGIASFYDKSSTVWEDIWGEHMHHGYYVEGFKPKNIEDHK